MIHLSISTFDLARREQGTPCCAWPVPVQVCSPCLVASRLKPAHSLAHSSLAARRTLPSFSKQLFVFFLSSTACRPPSPWFPGRSRHVHPGPSVFRSTLGLVHRRAPSSTRFSLCSSLLRFRFPLPSKHPPRSCVGPFAVLGPVSIVCNFCFVCRLSRSCPFPLLNPQFRLGCRR